MLTARQLSVLNVAFPFAAVGPDAVGGAEQVLSALDSALANLGHRSIVVACNGSRVAGNLVAVPRTRLGPIDGDLRANTYATMRAIIADTIRRTAIDLVHMHGLDFHAYLPPPGPPVIVTLHLPPQWYPSAALQPARPKTWIQGVSQSQDRALRQFANGPWVREPISNGVPVEKLSASRHARQRFALTLGRVCPEKGQHLAISAARIAGVPLLIAGEVFPYSAHMVYFQSELIPGLDSSRRWIGPVGFERKRHLLSAARCVLIPSLAPETSSLVAMEAASCGTPVIAFRSGALTEIVQPNLTGFLVNNAEEMAAAIHRTNEIDPEDCRRTARARFSLNRTIEEYLRLYQTLAASG